MIGYGDVYFDDVFISILFVNQGLEGNMLESVKVFWLICYWGMCSLMCIWVGLCMDEEER